MHRLFRAAVFATAFSATAGAAMADEMSSETRSIDARVVKVRLGGVIDLNVRQGATASLVISGDKEYVQKVTTRQNGDTLEIDMGSHFSTHRSTHGVHAELILPSLREFESGGVGATSVSGFNGDDIRLILGGAGAVNMTSTYHHVHADLTGVGGMTLNSGNSDSIELSMHGAGHMTVNGQSKMLHATLGGVGGLDAKQLIADRVELDMTGLGGAKVYAKNAANVTLSGLGSATVYGNPTSRNASTHGLGSVSWD